MMFMDETVIPEVIVEPVKEKSFSERVQAKQIEYLSRLNVLLNSLLGKKV
jgi:hypothetical protein